MMTDNFTTVSETTTPKRSRQKEEKLSAENANHKILIITEKPSVAADISKAIGKFTKHDNRYENSDYVISWALGHLVELYMPEDFDKAWKRWDLNTLPIIPKKFSTKPIEKTKKRFQELKKLMSREDIKGLINACDAGREGELIFTYIYEQAKCKKPFQRLWLSSMTKSGIIEAFSDLRPSSDMKNLQDAAKCRSEADWLLGINATRAVTKKMFSWISKQIATVGRVQTPTLAMIARRDNEIRNFKPQPFWKIEGSFRINKGEYRGILQKNTKIDKNNPEDKVDRFWKKEEADDLLQKLSSAPQATITETKKRTRQAPAQLYDLTALQRDANTRYGFSASMTLSITQKLYEHHKCVTYPRTDSRVLTEDYVATCYDILRTIDDENKVFAERIIQQHNINGHNRRIFDNKKVTDHFAIIPTQQRPKTLTEPESIIFSLIEKRFISVFFPDAEFDITTRHSTLGDYKFKTEGRVLVIPGWLEVYGRSEMSQDDVLPEVTDADGTPPLASVAQLKSIEDSTRAPAAYNEATLLRAMETAGKLLDDDDLADAMKERGLGTPATRAQIIEHLLALQYLTRDKKTLKSTPKAEDILSFIRAANLQTLSSPAMTGEWEYKLRQMEEGQFARTTFMQEIEALTTAIIDRTKQYVEGSDATFESTIISPTDHLPMMMGERSYRSQDGKLVIQKVIGGRRFSEEEIRQLISDRKLDNIEGFISKSGQPFKASISLDENFHINFIFGEDAPDAPTSKLSKEEIDAFKVIGTCPVCGSEVVATDTAYICKNYFDKKCKLRISQTMLDRELPLEQIQKMLTEGKSDLMENFKSRRTGKMFTARLVLTKDAKIRFEFK